MAQGFEDTLARAKPYGPAVVDSAELGVQAGDLRRCFGGGVSGLAASPDGSALFIAETGDRGRIHRVDMTGLQPAMPEIFATGLKDPRGLAVTPEGELLVVQNRLFPSRAIA